MKELFLEKDEFVYYCPYCHTEIADYTSDEIEGGTEFCGKCGREFEIIVL